MSIQVTIAGSTFDFPEPGDVNWGLEVTDWAVAVSSQLLQSTGGTFTLTGEADFGASFGLKSVYFKSRTANPAAAGAVRLARADSVSWRNAANSADLALGVDASDRPTWAGVALPTSVSDSSRIDLSLTNGVLSADVVAASIGASQLAAGGVSDSHVAADAAIARSKVAAGTALRLVYNAVTTGVLADLAALTASRVLVSDADGLPTAGSSLTQNRVVIGDANGLPTPSGNTLSQNRVLIGDANGVPVNAAAITASRALVSDADGVPTHSTVTSATLALLDVTSSAQAQINSKSLQWLATYSPSTAASVDITSVISGSTYVLYMIVSLLHGSTDSSNLWLRTDSNNGASFDAGASDYDWAVSGRDAAGAITAHDAADGQIVYVTNLENNAASLAVAITFVYVGSGTFRPYLFTLAGFMGSASAANSTAVEISCGSRATAAVIDAVQLLPSAGTITGEVRVYGIRAS